MHRARGVGRCKIFQRPAEGKTQNAPFIFFFTIFCQRLAPENLRAKSDKENKKIT